MRITIICLFDNPDLDTRIDAPTSQLVKFALPVSAQNAVSASLKDVEFFIKDKGPPGHLSGSRVNGTFELTRLRVHCLVVTASQLVFESLKLE
jgi:hypothetical protein